MQTPFTFIFSLHNPPLSLAVAFFELCLSPGCHSAAGSAWPAKVLGDLVELGWGFSHPGPLKLVQPSYVSQLLVTAAQDVWSFGTVQSQHL